MAPSPKQLLTIRPSRFGRLLVVLGVGIGVLSIGFGGTTQRACPGIESVVYEMVRVHPSGVIRTTDSGGSETGT